MIAEHPSAPIRRLKLPSPTTVVMSGVEWGTADVLFTPAYWRSQAEAQVDQLEPSSFRLGTSLKAECIACLLGGHGIPAEIGLAAFRSLNVAGLIDKPRVELAEVLENLSVPLELPGGNTARYRFAKQKSICVAELLNSFNEPTGNDCVSIRDWLTGFRGIGLKTASWIVRNWYASDEVAILDIHIHRAGLLAGFFDTTLTIQRHYRQLERQFLDFSDAIGVRPSVLDAIIWHQMKKAGNLVHRLLQG